MRYRSPGLLLTSQQVQVTVNGVLAPRASSDPSITAGTYLHTPTNTLSCTNLFGTNSVTRTFHWSNGQTSTAAFNVLVNNVGGQTTITLIGAIVSGPVRRRHRDPAGGLRHAEHLAVPGTEMGPGPTVLTISGT